MKIKLSLKKKKENRLEIMKPSFLCLPFVAQIFKDKKLINNVASYFCQKEKKMQLNTIYQIINQLGNKKKFHKHWSLQ
jgi:hypothetical protein